MKVYNINTVSMNLLYRLISVLFDMKFFKNSFFITFLFFISTNLFSQTLVDITTSGGSGYSFTDTYRVINNNYNGIGDGMGWSANLYLPGEMGASNKLQSMRFMVDYAPSTAPPPAETGISYTFTDVTIYLFHYGSNTQFTSLNRPDLVALSAVKVFEGDITFKAPDKGPVFCESNISFSTEFDYVAGNSLGVYIERTVPYLGTEFTSPYWGFKDDSNTAKQRHISNWKDGTVGSPLPAASLDNSRKYRYPQIKFNETSKANICISDCPSTLSYTTPACNKSSVPPTINPSASVSSFVCTDASTNNTSDLKINSSTGVIDLENSKPGTYKVKAIITAGTCEPIATLVINPIPDAAGAITGLATVCQNQTGVSYSVPSIQNATSYVWTLPSGATGTSTTNSISVNYGPSAVSGNITVKGVNACGDGASYNLNITVNPLPDAAGVITGNSSVCQGANVVSYSVPPILNATSYTWSYSGTGATINGTGNTITIDFSSTATSGNLIVNGTNTCGIGVPSANFAINILSNTINSTIKTPISACGSADGEVNVTGSGTGTISWNGSSISGSSPAATGLPYTISGLKAGSYSISFDNGACISTSNINLSDPGSPPTPYKITASGSTSFCQGQSITLTASPVSGTVNWTKNGLPFGNAGDNPIRVSTSGTYAVTVTVAGCISFANDTTINVINLPNAPIGSSSAKYCSYDLKRVSDLSPSGPDITWYNNSSGIVLKTDLLTSTSYYASQKTVEGCESTSRLEVLVTIINNITPTSGTITQPNCTTPGSVQVDNFQGAPATYGFKPSNGISISGTGLITASSGTYKFAVTADGCISDSATLFFNPVPGKPVITGAQTICVGQTITLISSNQTLLNTPLSWSTTDATVASVNNSPIIQTTVTGVSQGTVAITYTDINNCTETVNIQVDPIAIPGTASAVTNTICAGGTATLNLSGNNGTIQWEESDDNGVLAPWTSVTLGNGTTSSSFTTSNLTTTKYFRAAVTSGVCTKAYSNSVMISVSPTPSVGNVTSSSSSNTICNGQNTVLTLSSNVGSIQWMESDDNGIADAWSNVVGGAGETSVSYTTANLTKTMFFKAVVSSSPCTSVESNHIEITVKNNGNTSTSVTGVTPICQGQDAVFTINGTGTEAIEYTIGSTIATVNLVNGTKTITIPAVSVNQIITLNSASNGGCSSTLVGATAQINVKTKPAKPTLGLITQPTCISKGSVVLNDLPTTVWTLTPKQSSGSSKTGSTNSYTYVDLPLNSSTKFVVTLDGCTSDSSDAVVITDEPVKPFLEGANSICLGSTSTLKAWIDLTKNTKSSPKLPVLPDAWQVNNTNVSLTSNVDPLATTINIKGDAVGQSIITYTDNNNCSVDFTINVITANTPTGNATQEFCTSENAKISNLSPSGATIKWYNSASGGTEYTDLTLPLVHNQVYYATQTSTQGCESTSRLAVTVKIYNNPSPTWNTIPNTTACLGDTITYNTEPNMINYTWTYTNQVLNTDYKIIPSASSNIVKIAWLTSGQKDISVVYTQDFGTKTCTSSSILPLSASTFVNSRPTPTFIVPTPPSIYCSAVDLTYKTEPGFTNYTWKFPNQVLNTDYKIISGSNTNTIKIQWLTSIVNPKTVEVYYNDPLTGCASIIPASANTVVNKTPDNPTTLNDRPEFCSLDNATIEDLQVNELTTIKWYDNLGAVILPGTSLINGKSYFAKQTVSGCESQIGLEVRPVINVSPVDAGPVVNLQTFCFIDNPTIANLSAPASGNITWYNSSTNGTAFNDLTIPLVDGQSYWVENMSTEGCASANRVEVVVNVLSPDAPIMDSKVYCTSDNKQLKDIVFKIGTSYIFYPTSGGTAVDKDTYLNNGDQYLVSNFDGTCESSKALITITLNDGPSIPNLANQTLCGIDKPDLDLLTSKFTFPNGTKSWSWYLPNSSQALPINQPIATGTYWLSLKDENGCVSINKKSVDVVVDNGTPLVLNTNFYMCKDKQYTIADLSQAVVSPLGGDITWYPSDMSTSVDNKFLPNEKVFLTTYYGTYKNSSTGCESNPKARLDINLIAFNSTTNMNLKTQSFCKTNTYEIDDLDPSPYTSGTIAWFSDDLSSTALASNQELSTSDFIIFASEIKTVNNVTCVNPVKEPISITRFIPDFTTIATQPICNKSNGKIEVVNPDPSFVFEWANSIDPTNIISRTSLLKDVGEGDYILKVNQSGCILVSNQPLNLCKDAEVPQILTPTTTTGSNDTWVIGYNTKYPNVSISIYNRWGSEVFVSQKGYKDDWDGKSKSGDYLPTGTYYYIIDKGNGEDVQTGYIEIIK
ncbi:MAG: gliding motility-associated C-terminal domain-containing protein [Crocinitomicaceae bacterium]|nr:gliding motility-associated C-terminal domain-containing protein [Crocinitomicaceae bacterium]